MVNILQNKWIKSLSLLLFILIIISFVYILRLNKYILDSNEFKVIAVYDGDTIQVEKNGQTFNVRYLGLDTPELHKPETPIQCWAEESFKYNESLVLGKYVKLEKDIEDKDKYGRLLRYVYIDDRNIVLDILRNGYAYLYSKNKGLKFESDLYHMSEYAKNNELGLWKNCMGKDSRVPVKKDIEVVQIPDISNVETVITSTKIVLGIDSNSSVMTSTKTSSTVSKNLTTTQISKSSLSNTSSKTQVTVSYNSTPTITSKSSVVVSVNENCKIKGNINVQTKTKIYHMQGQRFYDNTMIKPEEGDKYFCTEQEEKEAGFVKSKV